jgi:hypothetical protein
VDGHDEHLTASRSLADLSTLPSRQRVADRDESIDGAVAILSAHVPNLDDGSCTGCRAQWGRWLYFEDCAQADWALRVVETHAAWDDDPPDPRRPAVATGPALARR